MWILGVAITFAGLISALWPASRAQAIEKRMASGEDQYFEEQRGYRAYPGMREPARIRTVGLITTIGGLIICVLQVFRG